MKTHHRLALQSWPDEAIRTEIIEMERNGAGRFERLLWPGMLRDELRRRGADEPDLDLDAYMIDIPAADRVT